MPVEQKHETTQCINTQISQDDLERVVSENENIDSISFSDIDVSELDFSILKGLKKLRYVCFENTKISKDNLEKLGNIIIDDGGVFNGIYFDKYDFSRNYVEIPSNIKCLIDIRSSSNLSKIKGLDNVKYMILSDCNDIKDLDFIFPNLVSLGIYDCGIETLEKIFQGCPNLEGLHLCRNMIKKLETENEVKLERLKELDVHQESQFEGFGNLEGMFPNVEELNICETGLSQINDISRYFPKLETLYLSDNPNLSDITPLLEYNRRMKRVCFTGTSIGSNMLDVAKKIGIPYESTEWRTTI